MRPFPLRIAVGMFSCPALSVLGWIVVGASLADRPLLAWFAAAFAAATAFLAMGAGFAFVGFVMELHQRVAWVFAPDGGPVERVDREEDVPVERRAQAMKLILSEYSGRKRR